MRVVNVVTRANVGGAGRIVVEHHLALLRLGVDSWLLTDESARAFCGTVPNVQYISAPLRSTRFRLLYGVSRAVAGVNALNISVEPFSSSEIEPTLKALAPQIVDMHWTSLSFASLRACADLELPWVHSLYDMRPFTGACHYSYECEQYTVGCLRCPAVKPAARPIPREQFRRQFRDVRDAPRGIAIGKSTWLTACARRSKIFSHVNCKTIHNGVNLEFWSPRLVSDPSPLNHVVVAASGSVSDPRKGTALGLEAVRKSLVRFAPNARVSIAGRVDSETVSRYPEFRFWEILNPASFGSS